jgi:ADP-L-glycero-D-manno-heptose 6-epimerase
MVRRMIVVTGGAGFIGSNLHAALLARGCETVVVDRLGSGHPGKWRNLRHHPPTRMVAPRELSEFLAQSPRPEMIFHLGAISSTTVDDGDVVWRSNVTFSRLLWDYCASRRVRLVYASSAATYGDGSCGFDDDMARLHCLRPLNLYGWSKHAFDLQVGREVAVGGPRPPQWVGLKFFNVYGPNEYHKNGMISVVKVKHDEVASGRRPTLFRSDRADVADGEQQRDFIWVGDVVDVMLWLLDTPGVNGLFNVGTGAARSYRDLARAVCQAAGTPDEVRFVDMPPELRGQYQSFTQAPIDRLRSAGYVGQLTPLEAGVARYVQDFLTRDDPYN